jgi:hypothetical protein
MDVICIDLTLCDSADVMSAGARAAYRADPLAWWMDNTETRRAAEMAADDAPGYRAHRKSWED